MLNLELNLFVLFSVDKRSAAPFPLETINWRIVDLTSTNCGRVTCNKLTSHRNGITIFLVTLCFQDPSSTLDLLHWVG